MRRQPCDTASVAESSQAGRGARGDASLPAVNPSVAGEPAMRLHGVVNASPDSLADFSVATTVAAAADRAAELLDQGCIGLDLGGAGSTQFADRVDIDAEWERLDGKAQALAVLCEARGAQLSVDSWQPEVVRRALECGATMINAADGLQNPAMVRLAAERDVPVVAPFVWGDDPKSSRPVTGDPIETICGWFRHSLIRWEAAGIDRDRLILDPGTGFGPPDWEWADRYRYQKRVYENLNALREFGLPVYLPLPWKQTAQHDELLEICIRAGFDYGRCHRPDRVLEAMARLGSVPQP